MLVTVAALSVETIVLTFLVPLTLMTALGGWCTDSDSYASCAARQHSADMTLLTLTVASQAGDRRCAGFAPTSARVPDTALTPIGKPPDRVPEASQNRRTTTIGL